MGCTTSTPEMLSATHEEIITDKNGEKYPITGPESIMNNKGHGTSATPVQANLRWGCDFKTADKICNYNRHFAEPSGSFNGNSEFAKEVEVCKREGKTMTFYDSNTGKALYEAPKGRTWDDFLLESKKHGWPSFRDPEVNWDNVRCLKNGETVSLAGSHLGHNLPTPKNRYCINLVCIAGRPIPE